MTALLLLITLGWFGVLLCAVRSSAAAEEPAGSQMNKRRRFKAKQIRHALRLLRVNWRNSGKTESRYTAQQRLRAWSVGECLP